MHYLETFTLKPDTAERVNFEKVYQINMYNLSRIR